MENLPRGSLLKQARETIDKHLPDYNFTQVPGGAETPDGKLIALLFQLRSLTEINPRVELSSEETGDLGHIVVKLLEWCADVLDTPGVLQHFVATIRRDTSSLVEFMNDDSLCTIDERSIKLAIYNKMGVACARAGASEAALAAYSKAQLVCMRLVKDLDGTHLPEAQHADIMTACLDFTLNRLSNAWKLHQEATASELLSQAACIAMQATLPWQPRFLMSRQIILACLDRDQQRLSAQDKGALSLLVRALQLIIEELDSHKDDAEVESSQKQATSLHVQALRLLSQEFLINGQALHALACMKNLRELQDPIADHPSLCLTAIEALIQVGQPEEAGAELQALVANKGASANQCLAGLTAAIAAPSCEAAVRAAAVQIIIKRGREDMTVVPYIVDILRKAAKIPQDAPDRALRSILASINGQPQPGSF